MCAKSKQMKVHTQIHKYFKVYKNIASEGKKKLLTNKIDSVYTISKICVW